MWRETTNKLKKVAERTFFVFLVAFVVIAVHVVAPMAALCGDHTGMAMIKDFWFSIPYVGPVLARAYLFCSRKEREAKKFVLENFPNSISGFGEILTVKGQVTGKEYRVAYSRIVVPGVINLCVHILDSSGPWAYKAVVGTYITKAEGHLLSNANAYNAECAHGRMVYQAMCRQTGCWARYSSDT